MKNVVLFILITVLFASIGVTISHALWQSEGPVAEPDFTGELHVIRVYQWTPGPNPKIIYVKDLPTSFYAVAATKIGWKGKVVYGLQSSGTLTKPDGTTENIPNGEEGGTVGPTVPILTHEELDAISFTYRTHKSYSSRIVEPNQSTTYTVNMTGRGLVKESTSEWKFDVAIQGFSLNMEYKSGQTVSFPMTEVSDSKSHTVGGNVSMPDSYECEHYNCGDALPRKDYHYRLCKEKVPGLFGFGEVDCDRGYYICQSHTCDVPGDHLDSSGSQSASIGQNNGGGTCATCASISGTCSDCTDAQEANAGNGGTNGGGTPPSNGGCTTTTACFNPNCQLTTQCTTYTCIRAIKVSQRGDLSWITEPCGESFTKCQDANNFMHRGTCSRLADRLTADLVSGRRYHSDIYE